MGAFMAALGPALAAGAKGVAKGAAAVGKRVGQQAKNTLKQRFEPGGEQQQKPQRRAPMQITPPNVVGRSGVVGSFKKGGRVRRTGVYLLHQNEHVIPATHAKKASRRKTFIKI